MLTGSTSFKAVGDGGQEKGKHEGEERKGGAG